MQPAIDRIIAMFYALKSYFLSQYNCHKILKIFFENETSLLWIKFLESQLKTINIYIKNIEEQKLCAVELISIMNQLIEKLKNKRDDLFLTSVMEEMLDNGEITRKKFTDICTSFYNLFIYYLMDWNASKQHIPELNTFIMDFYVENKSNKLVKFKTVNQFCKITI